MSKRKLLFTCALVMGPSIASAAVTLAPLTSFGVNGWLAPGTTNPYVTTGDVQRGLAYGNGHVYLVSRANVSGNAVNVRYLDPATGADLGGLSTSGVSGGTFPINSAAVGGDGAIYVANLTTNTTTSPYKVYKWTNEAATPTVAYTGNGGLAGARLGDDLAAIGSGSSTQLAAGYNSTPAVAGNNSYAIIDPTAGSAAAIAFTGTPPNAGDFRLGLTFVSSSQVLGTAGSSLYRNTTFSGTTGTLVNSPAIPDPAGASADRLLAYAQVGTFSLLAVQSIGDSHVSIYDVSNPAAPVYLASGNNTVTPATNGNGTGQIAWSGQVTPVGIGFQTTLYAMSTNQGIQAFILTVPEPATLVFLGTGLALLARPRRNRSA